MYVGDGGIAVRENKKENRTLGDYRPTQGWGKRRRCSRGHRQTRQESAEFRKSKEDCTLRRMR